MLVPVLEARGVAIAFGPPPAVRPVLEDLSFTVAEREFVCIEDRLLRWRPGQTAG
jgi:hypothetical protein